VEGLTEKLIIYIQKPFSVQLFKKSLYIVAEFVSKYNIFINDVITQADVDVFNLHNVLMRNLNPLSDETKFKNDSEL
jgi:hypothetical protein